jgi:superoxide reductase
MSFIHQIYKCSVCGHILEVVHPGDSLPICCAENMELLEPKTQNDAGYLKHVPVVERTEEGVFVKIGESIHPSEPGHHIEWIELIADGRVYKKFLEAGENPEAVFNLMSDKIETRAYCNIHGLWHNILYRF